MTGSYHRLADSKPRIKQDVLYSQTSDGVLFHNADLGFHIASKSAYRLACLLMPYLNGEHTVAQLCGGLDNGQRGMVSEIVAAMLDRGFARDTSGDIKPETALAPQVSARFAAQISYIDHYADSSERRFARLREARVAVLGDDLVARWCVAGLIRNGVAQVGVVPSLDRPGTGFAEVAEEIAALNRDGCAVELIPLGRSVVGWSDLAGFDAVLITDAGAVPGVVTGLLADGIPNGVMLLSATTFAEKVLVGPVMSAGRTGCWICAALRFGAHDESGAAADVWSRLVVPATDDASPLSGPHAAALGNLLAYEAFRVITGTMPAETEGTVIVQRLDSLDAVVEKLSAHPACPYCQVGTADDAADPIERAVPATPPVTVVQDETDADDSLRRLMETANRLVYPNVGVFTRFDDDQFTQLPLKVTRLRFPLGHRERRAVTTFDTHHLVGARWSALLAAAELYVEQVVPLPGLVHAPQGQSVVEPSRLAIGSGVPVAAGDVAHWVRATSLLSGDGFVVPAAAVRPFGAYNAAGMCVATSAGAGAGSTVAEALGVGLASVLAYDALNRATRGSEVFAVDPLTLATDPELDFLRRSADNLGLAFELLDLGEDRISGVHVLLARASGESAESPLWTIGADPHRGRAVARALRDLVGVVQVAVQFPDERLDPASRLLRAFDPYTLRPAGTVELGPEGAGPEEAGPEEAGPEAAWTAVLDRVATAGRDVLAVPTASSDLRSAGIETVRVLLVNGA